LSQSSTRSASSSIPLITESSDFPLRSALQQVIDGGKCEDGLQCNADVFVTKLDASGQLVYSTFLGGSGQETVTGIALDGSGQVLVTGGTLSTFLDCLTYDESLSPHILVARIGCFCENRFELDCTSGAVGSIRDKST
jgi:hypothetical protein